MKIWLTWNQWFFSDYAISYSLLEISENDWSNSQKGITDFYLVKYSLITTIPFNIEEHWKVRNGWYTLIFVFGGILLHQDIQFSKLIQI